MKNIILFLTLSLLFTYCQNTTIDSGPLSGIINENDEKTTIIKKLAQAYQDGNFDLAREYFTEDGVHYFNSI